MKVENAQELQLFFTFFRGMPPDPLERHALHVTSTVQHLATLAYSIIEAVSRP